MSSKFCNGHCAQYSHKDEFVLFVVALKMLDIDNDTCEVTSRGLNTLIEASNTRSDLELTEYLDTKPSVVGCPLNSSVRLLRLRLSARVIAIGVAQDCILFLARRTQKARQHETAINLLAKVIAWANSKLHFLNN